MRKVCRQWIGIILLFSIAQSCATSLWAEKERLVQTEWKLSDGIQSGEDIYFLSYYSLYLPGKVIIPLFLVTPEQYFFTDLSLYRVSAGGTAGTERSLTRLWSYGPEASQLKVDVQSCKFGRDETRLYFSWNGNWDEARGRRLRPTLEYDTESDAASLFTDESSPVDTDYKHPDRVAASLVELQAGVLPLNDWNLPSPLEYSSTQPAFLQKILVRSLGDRDLRSAVFTALDEMRDPVLLRETLRKMETKIEKASDLYYETYFEVWAAKIEMSVTLRSDRPEDIFSASYDNDIPLLKNLIKGGVSPDSRDSEGRTPLMYAVFGNAPGALRLLFEEGADPEAESGRGTTAWYYAATSPLRPLYLELWGK